MKLSNIRSIHFERCETFRRSSNACTEKDDDENHTADLAKA